MLIEHSGYKLRHFVSSCLVLNASSTSALLYLSASMWKLEIIQVSTS